MSELDGGSMTGIVAYSSEWINLAKCVRERRSIGTIINHGLERVDLRNDRSNCFLNRIATTIVLVHGLFKATSTIGVGQNRAH